MTYYTTSEFAKEIGVSPQTLRVWDKQGYLKPHHVSVGGRRMYAKEQIDDYFESSARNNENKRETFFFILMSDEDYYIHVDLINKEIQKLLIADDIEDYRVVRVTEEEREKIIQHLMRNDIMRGYLLDPFVCLNKTDIFYLEQISRNRICLLDNIKGISHET